MFNINLFFERVRVAGGKDTVAPAWSASIDC